MQTSIIIFLCLHARFALITTIRLAMYRFQASLLYHADYLFYVGLLRLRFVNVLTINGSVYWCLAVTSAVVLMSAAD